MKEKTVTVSLQTGLLCSHAWQSCFVRKTDAATYSDAANMVKTAKETGRFAAIGFQFCYHPAVHGGGDVKNICVSEGN